MFDSYIGDINHDISVLSMDKILYDSGFSIMDSEIHSDSEYETFIDALLYLDGYIDEDESVAHFDMSSLSCQTVFLRMVKNAPLSVRSMGRTPAAEELPKAS